MNKIVIRTTNNGWCSAKLTTRLIMQGLLEQNTTVGHYALAGLHSGEHQDPAVLLRADLNFVTCELSALRFDKNIVFFPLQKHRLARHTRPRRLFGREIYADKHLGLEQPPNVIDGAADFDRAGAGIKELRNHFNFSGKSLPGKGAAGKSEL